MNSLPSQLIAVIFVKIDAIDAILAPTESSGIVRCSGNCFPIPIFTRGVVVSFIT